MSEREGTSAPQVPTPPFHAEEGEEGAEMDRFLALSPLLVASKHTGRSRGGKAGRVSRLLLKRQHCSG